MSECLFAGRLVLGGLGQEGLLLLEDRLVLLLEPSGLLALVLKILLANLRRHTCNVGRVDGTSQRLRSRRLHEYWLLLHGHGHRWLHHLLGLHHLWLHL